jgi:hypothetical protein
MLEGFRAVNRRAIGEGSRYAVVAASHDVPQARERKELMQVANQFSTKDSKLVSMVVVVAPNTFFRGFLTVCCWMMPHIPPVDAAATVDGSVQAAVQHLRRSGVDFSQASETSAKEWLRRFDASPTARSI